MRGERYFADGHVRSFSLRGSELRGVVVGSVGYQPRIWVKGDSLAYHCDCPFSVDRGAYCKHLVALALAWLAREGSAHGARRSDEVGGSKTRSESTTPRRVQLHERAEIEAFLRRDVWQNLYHLGDLDDAFWPYTIWYAHVDQGAVTALALLYTGLTLPCLLALGGSDLVALRALLTELEPLLPPRFYCHLSPGAEPGLARAYRLSGRGHHLKMALVDPDRIAQVADRDAVPLSAADAREVAAFYDVSYPDHWFEPRMLETGCYFGRRVAARLVSVAGVHVYSRRQRVAALGNVATHPEHRGCGHATAVMARLCEHLKRDVDHVGLNVKADNTSALRCYERLGFEVVAEYEEYMAKLEVSP